MRKEGVGVFEAADPCGIDHVYNYFLGSPLGGADTALVPPQCSHLISLYST